MILNETPYATRPKRITVIPDNYDQDSFIDDDELFDMDDIRNLKGDKTVTTKSSWTDEEDGRLLELVDLYGEVGKW